MAATATFQAKVDPVKKKQVDELYKQLGTSTAEAFRIFVNLSIECNGFPFEVKLDRNPNQKSVQSYEEAEVIAENFREQKYNSVSEMLLGD